MAILNAMIKVLHSVEIFIQARTERNDFLQQKIVIAFQEETSKLQRVNEKKHSCQPINIIKCIK